MRRRKLAWTGLLLLGAGVAGCQAEPLLECDFQTDPRQQGWTYVHRKPWPKGFSPWQAESASPNNHFIVSAAGGQREGWHSPKLPVTPGRYYQASLRYRCARPALLGAIFYDPNGREMTPDHYSGVKPSEAWNPYRFCFRAKHGASRVCLRLRGAQSAPICADDVTVRPVSASEVREWIDRLYARMPPLGYRPPAGRWAHLPRTLARLRHGRPLRIVLLGDSIVNDTGNSAFEMLLKAAWPKARLEVVTSVRGGTGCAYYRRPGRVRRYVLDYEPNLVIIGGISNRRAEHVRDVVRQVRDGCDAEILVMTGAFGRKYPPGEAPRSYSEAKQACAQYEADLKAMVAEENAEFLDAHAAVEAYLDGQDRPYEWFLRDLVHPNELGRQVLGRILARYLSPDKACAAAVGQ
jgi:hypothetical protein